MAKEMVQDTLDGLIMRSMMESGLMDKNMEVGNGEVPEEINISENGSKEMLMGLGFIFG